MSVSWNALPYVLRAETGLTKFKKDFEITYFKEVFCDMRQ